MQDKPQTKFAISITKLKADIDINSNKLDLPNLVGLFFGVIDLNDYALLNAYVNCQITLTDEQKAVADLNQDIAIDGFDVIILDLYLNGVCDIEGNYI